MTQLSLLSAEFREPHLADLGGMLAAQGQWARTAAGVRLSILVAEGWRAAALVAECAARGVAASFGTTGGELRSGPALLVRTTVTAGLEPLVRSWTRGAVKAVPEHLEVSSGFLRCWAVAAGTTTVGGYEFGVDPRVSGMATALVAAGSRAGLAMAVIGVQSGRPVLRLVGSRRVRRLAELIGGPPAGAPEGVFPQL